MAGVLRVPSLLHVRVPFLHVAPRVQATPSGKATLERILSLLNGSHTTLNSTLTWTSHFNLSTPPFSSLLQHQQPPTDQGDSSQAERALAGPDPGLLQAQKGQRE